MKKLPTLSGTFSALKLPFFRYFYIGQMVSLIGTWARTAAVGWLAFQLTHSRLLLGVTFTLNTLPPLFISAYAGTLADRLPRLGIFKTTTWFAFASSALIAVLDFTGHLSYSLLALFSLLWGLASAFEMPARQSLMVELVGPKELVNAISLNSAMVNVARVIGPSVGGLLMARVGAAWCFLLDALSFLAVAYALGLIRLATPEKPSHPRRGAAQEVWRYLLERPVLSRTMGLILVVSAGGWSYISQTAAFTAENLGGSAWDYGWLLGLGGLGSCLAALYIASGGRDHIRESNLYWGIGQFVFFILLFGFQHQILPAALLLFGATFGLTLFFSSSNSLLQTSTPNEMRGRVMGIWASFFGGGMPLGSLALGWAASRWGSGPALQLGGIFCLLGCLLVLAVFRGKGKSTAGSQNLKSPSDV